LIKNLSLAQFLKKQASLWSHIARLVEVFPLTFNDEYVVSGQKVCFYNKKAQLVMSEIFMRFYKEDESFNFPDIDNLTSFVDNVEGGNDATAWSDSG
jgi:hypothetical protein